MKNAASQQFEFLERFGRFRYNHYLNYNGNSDIIRNGTDGNINNSTANNGSWGFENYHNTTLFFDNSS